jgi:hypothetical protein
MYHKVKNTLASLAVTLTMLGVSYSVGGAPVQQVAAPRVDYSASGIEAGLDRLELARKRDRGVRSQLSMPFYSFAPLLPRRES